MSDPTAVYLDLTDPQSMRVWRWLDVLGFAERIDVRPFCTAVSDPWECTSPPFSLELLMLMEQAREHGRDAVVAMVRAAFDASSPDVASAVAELAVWLHVGAEAGLPLAEYDAHMERLRAEVGLWMAEAREEVGVLRTPTVVFGEATPVHLQLEEDVTTPEAAVALLERIRARMPEVGRGPHGQ